MSKNESTKAICHLLGIARSSYYERKNRQQSNREKENERLGQLIASEHRKSGGIYGAPKIHQKLKQQQELISIKRVQRLMKMKGLRSKVMKKWKPYTSNKTSCIERENLLKQDFSTNGLCEKWVTDITYIHTKQDGWCYLSTIQDLHSKKIVGWKLGKQMTTELVLDTLNKAVKQQSIKKGLIIHSDLGSQYTSHEYAQRLQSLGIKHSFSKKGCPYDNAGIEAFHAVLKKEEVYQQASYDDFHQAHIAIFRYIEGFYNRHRIHSSIGYLTPQQCEDKASAA